MKNRSHDWTKKAPKPCEVLQRFIAKLNESMKLLESEESSRSFGKKSYNYWLWNMVHVWFFLKHCCNHRSKRIEAVRFHHITCWSNFVICSHKGAIVRVWSNWRRNKFELEGVISMQLRSKITVARNIKIHHHSLLNANRKMQLFSI